MRATIPRDRFVTDVPWYPPTHGGPCYGTDETYRRAAEWLKDCETVADWGGGYGYFGTFLPVTTRYTLIDGTVHVTEQVLANLETYHEQSDGILLRHVLDCSVDWQAILTNAIGACRQRMVVVTYTPTATRTAFVKMKSGWPIKHFNPDDLRVVMGRGLVRDEDVQTSHPERAYYLECVQ